MADTPDDEEPETFVQKAVKIGLIAVPLMMYVSWAHKKFVPCPRVKYHQARPSLFKPSIGKGKKKNKKGKCQDSRPDKQDHKKGKFQNLCDDSRSVELRDKRGKCQDSNSYEPNYQDQLSWLCETNDEGIEQSKDENKDCLKSSTSECCKSVNKHVMGFSNSDKTNNKQAEADPEQSNTQSETISPEAFDKLFEQHFQQCVDDFRQHKVQLEKELKRIKEDCETKQTHENPNVNKNGNYLECLTDLNLDKDFECDPNFHSNDSDAPYVVKDYKCKASKREATKERQSDQQDKSKNGYLRCLTDLNIDKHFEDNEGTKTEVKSYKDSTQKEVDECKTNSNNKPKQDENRGSAKKYSDSRKTPEDHEEELCYSETDSSRHKPKDVLGENNITNVKMDDCGCDPHFNTKDTGKYGTIKGNPCTDKSARDEDDALKDFWHACGPPRGLRTGCQAEGCNDPCNKQK